MSLSMRVLSVAPREADAVGSLKVCRGGTAVGETREEGGNFLLLIIDTNTLNINITIYNLMLISLNPFLINRLFILDLK